MSHQHHGHHHHHDVKNIKIAFFLNLSFTIIELVGGVFVNSVAILSDAVHDLGDSLSLGLSWYFQKISKKGRSKTFSYGYKRFSLLGAIINSIVLVVGSIFIITETIPRLMNPVQPDAQGMLYLAILGVIVNGATVFRLQKGESLNEKVVSLHLLEDVLGWVAVLIASIVMLFIEIPILDPILSLFIAAFILFNVFKNLKESFKIILQANPLDLNETRIKDSLSKIEGVCDAHDMHSWTMDGSYHVMTIHLVVRDNIPINLYSKIKTDARKILKAQKFNHITIEVESESEVCELIDC